MNWQKDYLLEGSAENVRADGRNRMDWREVQITESDLPFSLCSVKIAFDETQVLISLKAETFTPSEYPLQGMIECSARFSPYSSIITPGKHLDCRSKALTESMAKIFGRSILNSLCIVPGEICWKLIIDAYIIQDDGNVLDAIMLGSRHVINHARLPSVERSKKRTSEWIILSPQDCIPKPLEGGARDVPILISFAVIGGYVLADPTFEEEKISGATVSVAIFPELQRYQIRSEGVTLPKKHLATILGFARDRAKTLVTTFGQ